jgi:hypothetical protein
VEAAAPTGLPAPGSPPAHSPRSARQQGATARLDAAPQARNANRLHMHAPPDQPPTARPALGDRRDSGDGQVGWVVAAHKHTKTILRTRSDKPASAQTSSPDAPPATESTSPDPASRSPHSEIRAKLEVQRPLLSDRRTAGRRRHGGTLGCARRWPTPPPTCGSSRRPNLDRSPPRRTRLCAPSRCRSSTASPAASAPR